MPVSSFAAPAATTKARTNNFLTPWNDALSNLYRFFHSSITFAGFL